ncbi:MAG: Amidohydrolase [candidate division BRC1 bacterium ADurb.BinA292]|nr:MAG: Amidohydrolase [candidate division BRC1 bacterium ADurb.BinA292]
MTALDAPAGAPLAIIDSHQHFWDIARFSYPWMSPGPSILRRNYLPADLMPHLRECGVASTILVEAQNTREETRYLLDLADRHPLIAGVVGWVDLQSPGVEREIEAATAHRRLVGVRHQVESSPDDAWLTREASIRGLRALAAAGLPFDLIVFPRHLDTIPILAERAPELRMVLDHLGKPDIAHGGFAAWAPRLRRIAQFPNIYCKISGLVTEADHHRWRLDDLKPYVQFARECFGIDRLMWGSDWPVCLLAASYEQVWQLVTDYTSEWSQTDRAALFGGNAARFYMDSKTAG